MGNPSARDLWIEEWDGGRLWCLVIMCGWNGETVKASSSIGDSPERRVLGGRLFLVRKLLLGTRLWIRDMEVGTREEQSFISDVAPQSPPATASDFFCLIRRGPQPAGFQPPSALA